MLWLSSKVDWRTKLAIRSLRIISTVIPRFSRYPNYKIDRLLFLQIFITKLYITSVVALQPSTNRDRDKCISVVGWMVMHLLILHRAFRLIWRAGNFGNISFAIRLAVLDPGLSAIACLRCASEAPLLEVINRPKCNKMLGGVLGWYAILIRWRSQRDKQVYAAKVEEFRQGSGITSPVSQCMHGLIS